MLNCLDISSLFELNICGFFLLKSLNTSNVSLLYLIIKLSNSFFICSNFSLLDDSYLVVMFGPVFDFLTKAKPSSYNTLIPSIFEYLYPFSIQYSSTLLQNYILLKINRVL